jgi:hypothetical protein
MHYPSLATCRRRVALRLYQSGLTIPEAAAYLAALKKYGPLAEGHPAWVPASFATGFRPRDYMLRAQVAAACVTIDAVALEDFEGKPV